MKEMPDKDRSLHSKIEISAKMNHPITKRKQAKLNEKFRTYAAMGLLQKLKASLDRGAELNAFGHLWELQRRSRPRQLVGTLMRTEENDMQEEFEEEQKMSRTLLKEELRLALAEADVEEMGEATALVYAAFFCKYDVVCQLVELRADMTCRDTKSRRTALEWALYRNYHSIAFRLQQEELQRNSQFIAFQFKQSMSQELEMKNFCLEEDNQRLQSTALELKMHNLSLVEDNQRLQSNVQELEAKIFSLEKDNCQCQNLPDDLVQALPVLLSRHNLRNIDQKKLSALEKMFENYTIQIKEIKEETRNNLDCCCVCQENRKTVLLLPCQHMCLCKECSILLSRCPLCQANIIQKIDAFL